MPGTVTKPLAIVESDLESICEPVDEVNAPSQDIQSRTGGNFPDRENIEGDEDPMLPLPPDERVGGGGGGGGKGVVSINGSSEDEFSSLPVKTRFGSFREAGWFSLFDYGLIHFWSLVFLSS